MNTLILLSIMTVMHCYTLHSFINTLSLINAKFIDLDDIIINDDSGDSKDKYRYNITNVYFLQPICDKETGDNANRRNCLMTSVMNIVIKPSLFKVDSAFTFTLSEFMLEFNYTGIAFSISPSNLQLTSAFTYDPSSVIYNTNLPLFASSFSKLLTPVFNNTLPMQLSSLYVTKFNQRLRDVTASYPSLSTLFNLIALTGPRIIHYDSLDTRIYKRLTYIEFTLPELMKYFKVDLKDIGEEIRIWFDYSVNYDLNYKNGSFIMEEIQMKNEEMIWKRNVESFKPSNEDKEIKETIMWKFDKVLGDSLRIYYNGKNLVRNNAKDDEE